MAESTQQQQQQKRHQKSLLAGQGGVASVQTDSSRVLDRPTSTSPWMMRRLFRQQHQDTTASNNGDVICTTQRDLGLESERHPTADGNRMDVTAPCGPGVRWETEWTRVAEVLDRFFFVVFMALLLAPTVTILGIVRLFKPEL